MSKVPIALLLFPLWWVFSIHWTYIKPEHPKGLTTRYYRDEGLTDKIDSVVTARPRSLSPLWTDNGLMEQDQMGSVCICIILEVISVTEQTLSRSVLAHCQVLVNRAKLQLWSLLQFCCSRHYLLACSNLSQVLGRKNVYISLWWLKVLWFVYCWMFLMDVGYIGTGSFRPGKWVDSPHLIAII
jgi:hypothetical protein